MTRSSIILERSDDIEIYKYCSFNTAATWKGKLTPEQYVERDVVLSQTSKVLQRNDDEKLGVYLYVLRDYSLPSSTKFDNIVASVETLNRESWRINGPNGELTKVISAAVGNVFTLEQHRKKGYANHLVTQLNQYLENQLGSDGYEYLYSEVGDYYGKFGYENFHIPTHYFPINGVNLGETNEPFKYVSYEGFNHLISIQFNKTKTRILEKAKFLKEGETIISLIPNIDTYSWHHDRDLIICSKLQQDTQVKNFGAQLENQDHIIWYHDWNESKLVILKIFINDETSSHALAHFQNLIKIAVKEAREFKLKGVFLWDSSLGEHKEFYDANVEMLRGMIGAKLFEDNDSLSAIRFHDGTKGERVYWDGNEKWPWF